MGTINQRFTNPKVVKICVIASLIIFIPLFCIATIVAYVFGGKWIDPGEFSIINHYVSNLGSVYYTPAPFIFDSMAIITSFLMIPVFSYFKKNFNEAPMRKGEIEPLYIDISAKLTSFFLFIGDVGLLGIGIFSLDRSFYPYYFHNIFAIIGFGGFAVAAIFMGIIIIKKNTLFNQLIGYFMLIVPPIGILIYGILNLIFLEWLIFFGFFILVIPICTKLIRKLNSEIGC